MTTQAHTIASTYLRGEPSPTELHEWSSRFATVLTDVADVQSSSALAIKERGRLTTALMRVCDGALSYHYAQSAPSAIASLFTYMAPTFPEVALAIGYDEMRFVTDPISDPTLSASATGVIAEVESSMADQLADSLAGQLCTAMYRTVQFRSPDGVWHDTEGVLDAVVPSATSEDDLRSEGEWVDAFLSALFARLNTPRTLADNVISLPALQIPSHYGDSLLHSSTKAILHELQNTTKLLDDLHWRTLEEIVAELLFGLGLDVTITDRSHDGGRDVIARGELIPGEPTLLAVEVKHRKTVPVSEVRQALWANRHFPALLFVSSGAFSAGVYNERLHSDGALRLFLKDGAGLTQWIHSYCKRHPTRTV